MIKSKVDKGEQHKREMASLAKRYEGDRAATSPQSYGHVHIYIYIYIYLTLNL